MILYRSDNTNLIINITSDEPLGILDTDYIEDYNGVDGQLSVYNIGTLQRWAVVMVDVPAQTPLIPNDYFTGQKLLADLPDGDYQIQGRVRDLVGNYTILSAFNNPIGGERVMNMDFSIEAGKFIYRPWALHTAKPKERIHTATNENKVLKAKDSELVHIAPQEHRTILAKQDNRIYE